ncbi:MAG: LuxR C-terminal-related transcriptional regulator [Myxococcales bacterium]|nr:LuxR C-terminal-related transcriptional regulator [Myxococcales bacterium]
MNSPSPTLRAELQRFAARHRLTGREADVLFLLSSGLSNVPEIAAALGLSQNTVHNHFKNVFRRTGTHSKTSLLALLLERCAQRQASMAPFVQRPSVLVCEGENAQRALLCDALAQSGMRPLEERNREQVLERIANEGVDVVVLDATAWRAGLAASIGDRFGRRPLVVHGFETPGDREGNPGRSGGGSLATREPDHVAYLVLEALTNHPYERKRRLRVETDLRARLDGKLEGTITNLSYRGAFLALTQPRLERDGRLSAGSRLHLELNLQSERAIQVDGEVRWLQPGSKASQVAGLGLELVDLESGHQALVERFVRSRTLESIQAFARECGGPLS